MNSNVCNYFNKAAYAVYILGFLLWRGIRISGVSTEKSIL